MDCSRALSLLFKLIVFLYWSLTMLKWPSKSRLLCFLLFPKNIGSNFGLAEVNSFFLVVVAFFSLGCRLGYTVKFTVFFKFVTKAYINRSSGVHWFSDSVIALPSAVFLNQSPCWVKVTILQTSISWTWIDIQFLSCCRSCLSLLQTTFHWCSSGSLSNSSNSSHSGCTHKFFICSWRAFHATCSYIMLDIHRVSLFNFSLVLILRAENVAKFRVWLACCSVSSTSPWCLFYLL